MTYPTFQIEVKINGIWESLTNDVIGSQTVQYGILSNGQTDRVASTGILTFSLRNDSGCIGGVQGYYVPSLPGSKLGWRKGLQVRLTINHQGNNVRKFYGHITHINLEDTGKRVDVTVADWMDYAAKHPIELPTLQYDKRINDVVWSIVANMPIKPLHAKYENGSDVFSTAFDTVKSNTKAVSEFSKLANSEWGWIYVTRDYDDAETLVVESRHTRTYNTIAHSVPVFDGYLLVEGASYLITEDGSKLILQSPVEAMIDNTMIKSDVSYGDNLLNQVTTRAYPRFVDSNVSVLWSLNSPIVLAPGEIKSGIKGAYKDPISGASKVAGKDMVAPVSGTDYAFYQNSDGTGTNLTANLQVTAVYGAEGVEYTLTNSGISTGYVTKLQARGKGIFTYDSVEITTSDPSSIVEYGLIELNIDQKYQSSTLNPESIGRVVLDQNKIPRTILNSVDFIANSDDHTLNLFMYCDIGDLVIIKDDRHGINGYFHIQGIKFTIHQGGIIYFSWILKESLSQNINYWILNTSELNINTVLGY